MFQRMVDALDKQELEDRLVADGSNKKPKDLHDTVRAIYDMYPHVRTFDVNNME
jgi:hypothetical protein